MLTTRSRCRRTLIYSFFVKKKSKKRYKYIVFAKIEKYEKCSFILTAFALIKEREDNKNLKVHEKLRSRKLVEGMKAGLRPDISDDENPDEDDVS